MKHISISQSIAVDDLVTESLATVTASPVSTIDCDDPDTAPGPHRLRMRVKGGGHFLRVSRRLIGGPEGSLTTSGHE